MSIVLLYSTFSQYILDTFNSFFGFHRLIVRFVLDDQCYLKNRQDKHWLAKALYIWIQTFLFPHRVTVLHFKLSLLRSLSLSFSFGLLSDFDSGIPLLSDSHLSFMVLLLSFSLPVGESGSEEMLGLWGDPALPVDDKGLGRRLASSFFHFIRLFWNHILICLSVRFNMAASSIRLGRDIYLLKWNSFSNSNSCPRVYAVLVRLFSSSNENWAPESRTGKNQETFSSDLTFFPKVR